MPSSQDPALTARALMIYDPYLPERLIEPLRFALRLIEPVLRIRALDTSKSRHQLIGG
jgi:hypothetical protein